MRRVILCIGLAAGLTSLGRVDEAGGHLVNAGGHNLFIRCTGGPSKITVILENGLGTGLDSWKPVQAKVEEFSRVCSYERAGEGHSDKPSQPQTPDKTPDTIVADLRSLLEAEKIPGPYVLVGASLGGIYVRRFALRHPGLTAGIVLVDSSHEEQYSHYAAISPSIAERYATQDGRFERRDFLRTAGQLEPGTHLQWRLDVPLIVLEHKRLIGAPRTEEDRLAADWHSLQVDLAGRSKHGRLIETNSGHFIAGEQPEVVVKAVRDVIGEAKESQ